jgi:hypothetical protein
LGTVKGTEATVPQELTVPIVGASGKVGHVVALLFVSTSLSDQTPFAELAVGSTRFEVIMLPG